MVLSRSSLIEMPFIDHNTINSVIVVTFIHLEANSRSVGD